jgi:Raf kinase inhibitor-like YbhB/YbcL family protein
MSFLTAGTPEALRSPPMATREVPPFAIIHPVPEFIRGMSASNQGRGTMNRVALGAAVLALSALGAQAAYAQNMSLTSAEVSDGGAMKDEQVLSAEYGFGCKGGNISPSLSWSGAPSGTKSFVITNYDPDAPTGSGFWHWVVFNIPAGTTSIPKNAGDVKAKLMPEGAIQSRNDISTDGWIGPCPPADGTSHRYIFTVFAVDEEKLQYAKDHNVSAALVGFELHFHTLAKASLVGMYGRPAEKK